MRKPSEDQDLARLRERILAADRALLEAFQERIEVARQIRHHKLERGYELIDSDREQELLRLWRELAREQISSDSLRQLFETVLALSKREAWGEGTGRSESRR
jgi:chorismate mutase/prephenate dehydratase